jgi:hypothetical protein
MQKLNRFNLFWIVVTSIIIFFSSWLLWFGSLEQYNYLKRHLILNIFKRVSAFSIFGSLFIIILFIINLIKTKSISKSIIIFSYGQLLIILLSFFGSLLFFKKILINQ